MWHHELRSLASLVAAVLLVEGEAAVRLMPQLIKNEWKEKGVDPSAVAPTL